MMQPRRHRGAVAKPDSVSATKRADNDVTTGLHLTIGLHVRGHATVEYQRLLGLARPSSQGVPAYLMEDQGDAPVRHRHDQQLRYGRLSPWLHRQRSCTDTHFGYQLHRHVGSRIHVLKIVNRLGQIFD